MAGAARATRHAFVAQLVPAAGPARRGVHLGEPRWRLVRSDRAIGSNDAIDGHRFRLRLYISLFISGTTSSPVSEEGRYRCYLSSLFIKRRVKRSRDSCRSSNADPTRTSLLVLITLRRPGPPGAPGRTIRLVSRVGRASAAATVHDTMFYCRKCSRSVSAGLPNNVSYRSRVVASRATSVTRPVTLF